MTNKQLLTTPKDPLSDADCVRQHTLLLASLEQTCPVCQFHVNVFAAAGIDIDDYDFGKTTYLFVCPRCQTRLDYVVPIIGVGSPWHWRLEPIWLREQLDNAKAWENQQKEEP